MRKSRFTASPGVVASIASFAPVAVGFDEPIGKLAVRLLHQDRGVAVCRRHRRWTGGRDKPSRGTENRPAQDQLSCAFFPDVGVSSWRSPRGRGKHRENLVSASGPRGLQAARRLLLSQIHVRIATWARRDRHTSQV
jgi:hypothetical protein